MVCEAIGPGTRGTKRAGCDGAGLGRSVAGYLGTGARAATGNGADVGVGALNRVAYVWCGPHGIDRAG